MTRDTAYRWARPLKAWEYYVDRGLGGVDYVEGLNWLREHVLAGRIRVVGLAGFGMAINVLVKMLMDIPYFGFIAGALLFVVGHTFNVALSLLGAFVHSMRLQFVEFFPKFFSGGGTDFRPLTRKYKHIAIKE